VAELDASAMEQAADTMLRRLSYVEFFGAVINFVPANMPYANGTILADAVTRPFMPRIFFPAKSVIDDTELTNRYTGGLADNSDGSSISLGFVAESYIDFGPFGMMFALAAIGFFYGYLYNRLMRATYGSPLLGMSMTTAMLLTVGTLDNSFIKVFGGIIATLMVVLLIMTKVIPSWYPWLSINNR
jgi:hypothetical protein